MNKYYYDNVIDALYMAEHFGVKYSGDSCLIKVLKSEEIAKLYVALESMDIFEPKEGDVITWTIYKGQGLAEQTFFKEYNINKDKSIWNCLYDWVTDQKIIQRNNTAFIMPKVEEND